MWAEPTHLVDFLGATPPTPRRPPRHGFFTSSSSVDRGRVLRLSPMSSPTRPGGPSGASGPRTLSAFVAFLLFAGLGGLLTAGVVMPAVAAVGQVTEASSRLFDELPADLGNETMSDQSVLLDRNGDVLARFYMWNRIVVPMAEIAPIMGKAVVAVEDRRFFEHGGVDPEGLARAAVNNLSGGDTQGASTLTQQYVKNVLVEHSRIQQDEESYEEATERTMGRKLREAKLAIAVEKSRSKKDILEGYLNIAQFGVGVWGVEAASQYFFGHSAKDLSISEAALLAGVTNSPSTFDPERNPEASQERRDFVLRKMQGQGIITEDERAEATALDVEDMLEVHETSSGCEAAGNSAYFCQYVRDVILDDPVFGETRADRSRLLLQGGLTIKTTIDPAMQKNAYKALTDAIPVDDSSGISNAISTVEPGTGEILAMAQNTKFGKPTKKHPRNTEVNYNTDQNYGGSSGFQVGSTFKAFVLTAWLQAGKSLMDPINGSRGQHFPPSVWTYDGCTNWRPGSVYSPNNVEGTGGRMTVLQATKMSVNTAFVNMASQLNMCDIADTAASMGVHLATGPNEYGDPFNFNPSMVLGSNTIAPLTMAAAFATYAANGTHCTPVAILSVTDRNGEELPVPQADCKEVLDPKVAATVNYALNKVTDAGATGAAARLPNRPVAGKTGTANEDMAAWFVGYVPQASTAVWVGHSEGSIPMMRVTINGQYYHLVYGGKMAAPIWQNYMEPSVKDWKVEKFASPQDKLIYGERVQVPWVLGLSEQDARARLESAGFRVQVGDPGLSDQYPRKGEVAWQSTTGTERPGAQVTIRVSAGPVTQQGGDDKGDDDKGRNRGDNGNNGDQD
ncbi:glycosyl transferase [Pseudactinotalea sp. HY160]|nr:glycosyl transferase [Pseudactinotalea sp. HY160]